jgi:hypothetical protein
MVASLYVQLRLENGMFDPKLVLEAIERGHTWALPMIFHGGPGIDPAVADEVIAIMLMYQHIEAAWDHLSSEDRSIVAAAVPLQQLGSRDRRSKERASAPGRTSTAPSSRAGTLSGPERGSPMMSCHAPASVAAT